MVEDEVLRIMRALKKLEPRVYYIDRDMAKELDEHVDALMDLAYDIELWEPWSDSDSN